MKLFDYTIWQNTLATGFSRMNVWIESIIESGELGSERTVDITYANAAGKRYKSSHLVRYENEAKQIKTVFLNHRAED